VFARARADYCEQAICPPAISEHIETVRMRPAREAAARQVARQCRERTEARNLFDRLVAERETQRVLVRDLDHTQVVFVEREQTERPLTLARSIANAAVRRQVNFNP